MTALTAQSSTREGADFGFRSFVFIASLLLAWISTAPFTNGMRPPSTTSSAACCQG